ncbi:alpha/beta fold hydrolase [Bacillus sp. V5-8f]|uniref:alpha/beta fold hydrolase n=1 Tax=Bacillus sp. V5-8f TaxID=2053044 RepID=UPI000C76B804|nr:alpha/beta fold hydrolase [Bacillus sp. V5-8f]PLT35403.1 alpha/beta hydrolase [Bacillus sp. V5-8f]
MPFANHDDVSLYYEVHGEGDPLLMIMGLGYNSLSWHRTLPALSKHFQVIVFDNRGVGKSSKPEKTYSIEMMADDAKAVLDAASIDKAHVYGISMGGMIAQRLAINHPDRVRSLVLGCTTAGGPTHVQPSPQIMATMVARAALTGTPEENAWAAAPIVYSQSFIDRHRDMIQEDIEQRIQIVTPPHAYLSQLQACGAHNTSEELDKIKVPTLVIHGNADELVPYDNGKMLAERIKGAEFHTISGAGHIFFTEAVEESNDRVLQFLTSH